MTNATNIPRIYLIEDHGPDVFLVEKATQDYGIHCDLIRFVDGGQALEALRSLPSNSGAVPDLILLDLNLPCVGGLELLRELRKNNLAQGVPVIVLTSSQAPGDKLEAARLGVSRFLTKPTEFRAYLQLVAGAIIETLNRRVTSGHA